MYFILYSVKTLNAPTERPILCKSWAGEMKYHKSSSESRSYISCHSRSEPHALPSPTYSLWKQPHNVTVNEQGMAKTHLRVRWARDWEDSWAWHVLDSVSDILGIAGDVSLKGGVRVKTLRVCMCHCWPCHCMLLVHGRPHRDHWHDCCCRSYSSCHCYSGRLRGHSVVCQPTCCFWSSTCATGSAASGTFSLRWGPTNSLFIKPIPLMSYFKEDFWVYTTSFGCLFHCHTSFFQHQIVLGAVKEKQKWRMENQKQKAAKLQEKSRRYSKMTDITGSRQITTMQHHNQSYLWNIRNPLNWD